MLLYGFNYILHAEKSQPEYLKAAKCIYNISVMCKVRIIQKHISMRRILKNRKANNTCLEIQLFLHFSFCRCKMNSLSFDRFQRSAGIQVMLLEQKKNVYISADVLYYVRDSELVSLYPFVCDLINLVVSSRANNDDEHFRFRFDKFVNNADTCVTQFDF